MNGSAQENQDLQLYHFSRKVVILSVLFFTVNIALYLMGLFGQPTEVFREVAPRLVFAGSQDVFVKTPYDEAYLPAQADQTLFAGMSLKTGDQSFAEIQLEGSAIRLDQNTEIRFLSNNFRDGPDPRLTLSLLSGSLWVNAFEPISIRTAQAQALFSHNVGVYTYTPPLNRIMSITQSADIALTDPQGAPLAQFILPLKNQVAFSDGQLIPEYSRLEYSKLKKELKLGPVSKAIFTEDWIHRNTADDLKMFLAENHYIFSKGTYDLEDRYYMALEALSLNPSHRTALRLTRAKILLKYLLGGVQSEGTVVEANELMKKFVTLIEPLKGDPLLKDMIERQFFAIQNARPKTPAYLAKAQLRDQLYSRSHPELLRTLLVDVDFLLRILDSDEALKVAEGWLAKWDESALKSHPKEFNLQSRIYHSVMVANADRIDSRLLSVLENAEDIRLASSANSEDALYEIALERLGIAKTLVASSRYAEAKSYLRTSYSKLSLDVSESSAAARDIFIQDATFLADRIAFAELTLHGSAGSMDEGAFNDYLSTQERNKTLEQRFNAFLEEAKGPEVKVVAPTPQEISQRFGASRIAVLDEDISTKPNFEFDFLVKNARLVDRALDGSAITFDATYDSTSKALYDITLNGTSLKGNYLLDDFVRIALAGPEAPATAETPTDLSDTFLNLGETEEALRSQVVAQDLAAQLLVSELGGYGILIASTKQIAVLNPATLTEFHVTGAIIEDTTKKRTLTADFDYNSLTKLLSRLKIKDLTLDLPPEIPAPQFATTVFNVIYGKEEQDKAMKSAIVELSNVGYLLLAKDAKFADAPLNLIEFQKMRLKAMPAEFSGTYNRQAKTFVRIENPLLSLDNADPAAYATQVARLFVISALAKNEITITEDNLRGTLPSETVKIVNYTRGDKTLSFTYDIVNNRLTAISLLGSTAKVETMTFEEFKLIGGGESSAPAPQPATPALSEPESEPVAEPEPTAEPVPTP